MTRVVTWEPSAPSLPRSVVAIGVFDGVHLGHQALLAETIADAAQRSASPVAITFDRDPDQIVTPDTAAPQLLTLDDKLTFIGECGIDTVLVVPFTAGVAAMSPTTFLDSVVMAAVDVVSVHVGNDFRFGAKAAGDLATLETWAHGRGVAVTGQSLFNVDGAPVTSTRIRALVAEGDVIEAARLLGRAHRVHGSVVKGREAGRALGFPTANLSPQPYAALPSDGVYAGRAVLADGSDWPAAVSVGTPPSFPEARDYLEVHIIGFDGDLYGDSLTVEFLERLRDLRAFSDLAELSEAIRADVARAAVVATAELDVDTARAPNPQTVVDHDGAPGSDHGAPDAFGFEDAWQEVATTALLGPAASVSSIGRPAYALTMPLDAANVPYRWEPFDPQDASPTVWRGPVTFHLVVPYEFADEASALLADVAQGEPTEDSARDSGKVAVGAIEASDAEAGESAPDDLAYWEGEDISDEDLLDDPAALAAAQAAVNEARSVSAFSTAGPSMPAPDDPLAWVYLAEGFAPGPIEFLSTALNDAEIDTLWEPFPPEKRAAFWGKTNLRVYVSAINLTEARALAVDVGVLDDDPDPDADPDIQDETGTGAGV